MTDKKALWNEAGRAGLVLGGISLLYMLCNFLLGKLGADSKLAATLAGLVDFFLWAAKFTACIFLMRTYMRRFAVNNDNVTNSDTFRFGCTVALLSALIYSAGYMAYVMFIDTDVFSKSLELFADSPMITSEAMDMMEQMMPKMPTMTFFMNLFYCWTFGTVLSAILSRNIPPQNPFTTNTTNDQ